MTKNNGNLNFTGKKGQKTRRSELKKKSLRNFGSDEKMDGSERGGEEAR